MLIKHLQRQTAFSKETFGPGERRMGIRDHILKEVEEIRGAPHDLEEWADLFILACDGAVRCGATPADIVKNVTPTKVSSGLELNAAENIIRAIEPTDPRNQVACVFAATAYLAVMGAQHQGYDFDMLLEAVQKKQEKNEGRQWPDWRAVSQDKAIEHVR